MITYYPDGSWSTEEIASYEVNDVRQSIKRLGDDRIKAVFETLVHEYVKLAESYGSKDYSEDCEHDCRHCDFSTECDDCEYSDVCDHDCRDCEYADCCEEFEPYDEEDEDEEDKGAPNPTPDIRVEEVDHVDRVDPCRDCEFHVVGFPCSKTTKKKKGCAK